jgi:enoyl-CoA hydratase/carnithine racemase
MNTVLVEKKDNIGWIILNRPNQRNALSIELMDEMQKTLRDIAKDKHIHAVIIKGNGPEFCSGHDMKELVGKQYRKEYFKKIFSSCSQLMQTLQKLPQPVIAQVHGAALAAGCQLVAECDLAIADTCTHFSTPGVKIGLFCSTPMVPLSRSIQKKRALDMLFSGRFISAQEAKEFGLINRVVEPKDLERSTVEWACEITQYSLQTLELGKRAFYQQINKSKADAYEYAIETMAKNCLSEDAQEGMRAFLEKRSPVWKER